FMSDRYLAIQNAKMIQKSMKDLHEEINFKEDGMIQKRAHQVLDESLTLLREIKRKGMFHSLADGVFADTKRPIEGGKGLDGVFQKSPKYLNVISERLEAYFHEN
ncbi:MAG: D-lysine 5,6-aminomutase subunit alpha, partial [Bacilli bacterium]|nr:D-lysine 5,6-aminomutase subunit alpha [Bacilli bacterium]